MIKQLISLLFIVLISSLSAQNESNRGFLVQVGDQAPDFTAKLTNGKIFKLSDQKGKIVMLQFTASWCGVCRKEMPFIEKDIWLKLKDKKFVLIGVDRDEPLEIVQEYAQKVGISYPLALDPQAAIFGRFADLQAGVTRNVIIDESGKIIYLSRLFNPTEFNEMTQVIFNAVKKIN